MVTSWPMTFTVGVTTPGLWRGGGELSVAPGSLVCTPGRLTASASSAQPVKHEEMQVDVFVARLVPPWFNVTVPIRGERGTVVVSMWILARRKLRQALQEAGFDVTEHVTWFDRGFRWGEMEPRAPWRRPSGT